jgi:hypothetical protein
MKAKYVLAGIVVLALLYGTALYLNSRWFPATPPTLWLGLTGTPERKVAGTYSVDGVQTSFRRSFPAVRPLGLGCNFSS